MVTKTISIQNLAQEFKRFGKEHTEQMEMAAARGVIRSVPDLVAKSPVDTGQYASSWDFTKDEKSIILGNYAPHAPIIEFGARPFKPPIGPLLAWAKRVLADPSQPPNYSDRVWGLARGTQKKIEERGMEPRHVLTQAIPDIIENIRREIINEVT